MDVLGHGLPERALARLTRRHTGTRQVKTDGGHRRDGHRHLARPVHRDDCTVAGTARAHASDHVALAASGSSVLNVSVSAELPALMATQALAPTRTAGEYSNRCGSDRTGAHALGQ